MEKIEKIGTKERILDAALSSFSTSGFDATSLDAIAESLDIRKQTILYHFATKKGLLNAVVERAAENLITSIEEVLNGELKGWERIEALARMIFRLALREPLLLGLLREVSRPGSVGSERLKTLMTPLMDRAIFWMQSEMEIGRMRRTDPRLVLLSAYSTVVGLATEIEVLRTAGIEQALRPITVRRRELIRFLRVSLDPEYLQTK
ncbi:MAG: TetR/AcrR family transcriptional regulator [Actinomycetota bacterium]|nr:TetR family transcriptional regulator [Acidimicrobiales bacterium]MEC7899523.1 TetR/AcrR family transcriptional regulator [Actinomycetota bacterium]|tara:strand:- start:698 stop:1315 length:618 start_codon:yes stop_codon:yes gene_type:complete